MTLPYTWNPMPHTVSVECPDCQSEANFEFAECVKIKLRADIDYFKKSQFFEVVKIQNSGGQFHNFAFYYHKRKQTKLPELVDLPDNYDIKDWAHSHYLYRSHGFDIGVLVCTKCQAQRKHNLKWPDDAYFKIQYKGQTLWAFDKSSGVELLNYIQSTDRNRANFLHRSFLMKVPTFFLNKKARPEISKKLSQILKPNV